jgi:hypothetical protein
MEKSTLVMIKDESLNSFLLNSETRSEVYDQTQIVCIFTSLL